MTTQGGKAFRALDDADEQWAPDPDPYRRYEEYREEALIRGDFCRNPSCRNPSCACVAFCMYVAGSWALLIGGLTYVIVKAT